MGLFLMILAMYVIGGVVTLPHRTARAYRKVAPTVQARYSGDSNVRTEAHRRDDARWIGGWTTIWWPGYYVATYLNAITERIAFPELREQRRQRAIEAAQEARMAAIAKRGREVTQMQDAAAEMQAQLRRAHRDSLREWDKEFNNTAKEAR